MLELQPFGILLASCGLEMNNGRQHRQLSAPLAPSSPSQCPPGTPQVPATWKINPPASLITVMCQEPCSRSASQIPVINSLQFAAALLGRSRVAAGRAPWASPVLGGSVFQIRACGHRRVPAAFPSPGRLAAWTRRIPSRTPVLPSRGSPLPPLPACRVAWPGAICSLPIADS